MYCCIYTAIVPTTVSFSARDTKSIDTRLVNIAIETDNVFHIPGRYFFSPRFPLLLDPNGGVSRQRQHERRLARTASSQRLATTKL